MEIISKPSAASGTPLRSDVFGRARIKLTLLYLLVIFVVTTLFSLALYTNLMNDLRESVGGSLREEVNQERFFENRGHDIFTTLLLVDGAILLVSCATSYFFAGYTLRPIKSIMEAQERFASDAAHELRTPLAVIQTQIEVFLRGQETLSGKVIPSPKNHLTFTRFCVILFPYDTRTKIKTGNHSGVTSVREDGDR